ncbi:MAG: SDR family oxidoreductase [Rhizonema sp. NSF051]|nr:SDR family oxidoreductase [Rhizonema sp. NSF051]
MNSVISTNGSEIAIIGLTGRFPGAKNIDEFWKNLQNGRESVSFFTDEELLLSGVSSSLLSDPKYVKAQAILEDVDFFDASFFGFNPREAEITDPQHRLFLECAWEALESAGYDSEACKGTIGVYAGSSLSRYLLSIYLNQNIINSIDTQQLLIAGDKDYLTTRISYKLNLEGPSYTVQTACSTSLVAIHVACQSLLNVECDIALAGGVSIISASRKAGYFYTQGGIFSPDGHCRAFDAKAQGTVGGEGVGIVVLKRLEEALADGDCIHAVIKGSAINNDGSFKLSYTAPRIDTQAHVIRTAQVIAEVEPETITYIEAHGTGTPLGDPIEIAALTQAFGDHTQKKGFCAIGSVKTNIGHLDVAAGVTGLIKTTLALKHKQIPPSLHFQEPSPQIDFVNSPFYVNNSLSDWKANINGTPRRAGVNSFGIGGTNAHVILEEAPVVEPSGSSRPWQLLLFSAKTSTAIETVTTNIAAHFQQQTSLNLADVAYTLQVGRRAFNHRRIVVCQDFNDAVKVLSSQDPQRVFTHYQEPCDRSVVFMFSGQGAQYVNMGRELYQSEPIFREQVDECSYFLKPLIGLDLRTVLYPDEQQAQDAAQQLLQTAFTQPALFVIEYALAQLWMAWGVQPEAMIGHSIGEYVAATVAGVFSLEEALALVANRGKLMQQCKSGGMLSVQLPQQSVQPLLGKELSIAASNAPCYCVVSGTTQAIEQLQQQLQEKGVGCRRLHTNHAFHSQMMEPIIEPFTQLLQNITLNQAKIPFISNVSGTWITPIQATDPDYWARHLRQPVRFNEGIAELLTTHECIFLEVGPGRTLSTFVKQHRTEELAALTSLRHPQEQQSDVAFLLNTLGRLWLFGIKIDWSGFYTHEGRHRLPLPTYPFERQRYWIEANPEITLATVRQEALDKKPNIADWFYVPVWKQSVPLGLLQQEVAQQKLCWLVFVDAYGVGAEISKRLEQQNQDVITVMVAEQFTKLDDRTYAINPRQRDDYDALLKALQKQDLTPQAIAHFWSITPNDTLPCNSLSKQTQSPHQFFEDCQHLGFWSLLFLTQALGKQDITNSLKLIIVTSNVHDVTGDEKLYPEKATVLGPCKVIPKEYPNINCCSIDVVIPDSETPAVQPLIENLLTEFIAKQTEDIVAYRGHHRWVQKYEAVRLDERIAGKTKLKEEGVYLITGGLGGIGLVLAEYLAKTVQAKLILIGRRGLPERSQWSQWLTSHDSQDAVSRKIQKVLVLEELGAQVQINSADVTNPEQMQVVIAQTLKQFGQINGVIHAAGIAGGGVVQLKTSHIAANVLAPKVKGTLVLEEVLKNINLDFFVLCSSMSSILGGFGQVDYCAANAFLDAYAHRQASTVDQFTVSINWDTWQTVGMAVETVVPDALKQKREESLEKGILPQEGADAFNRILGSGLPHVVVSTQDFQTVIEQNHSFDSLEEGFALLEEKLAGVTNHSKPTHPRPNLGNDYIAPRNEVEQTVAEIWQQLLGIEQIGIYDNFFDLGGHSLLATQIISRLRKEFHVDVPLHSLFETPTIFDQVSAVKQIQGLGENNSINTIQRIDRGNAQQMLGKLDQISDQEVDSLLNEMLAQKEVAQ